MEFFTRYNPPPSPVSNVSGVSRTKQEFKRECDINVLVARAVAGDLEIPPISPAVLDATILPNSYEDAMDIVLMAQKAFASMPSSIRDRFGNDPGALLAFLGDSANRDEAVKLGLIKPSAVSKPDDQAGLLVPQEAEPIS